MYKTTPVFLRSFGLSSLADLPPLPDKSDTPSFFDLPSDDDNENEDKD